MSGFSVCIREHHNARASKFPQCLHNSMHHLGSDCNSTSVCGSSSSVVFLCFERSGCRHALFTRATKEKSQITSLHTLVTHFRRFSVSAALMACGLPSKT